MHVQQEVKAEIIRRKREADKQFMQMLLDKTPEGKARLKQFLQEEKLREQQRQDQISAVADVVEDSQNRNDMAIGQTSDDIIHGRVLQRLGDYRKLYFYNKSKVVYDLTFHFCDRFITEYHDRTKDQMIQAARSGKQNFVEGMQDGQADFEKATFLVTIGQGSLQELREDYEDYLRTRNLTIWTPGHPRYNKLVEFCKTNNDIRTYAPLFNKMNDEELANLALTLIHQTDYLIEGFLKKLEQKFIELGGVKERMRRIRNMALGKI